MDEKQVGRYSEKEMELIKQNFGNTKLLRAIQKVFLQTPLDAVELATLTVFKDNELLNKILRKMILPELTDDVPYNQVWDLTGSIDFKTKMSEDIVLHVKANEKLINYFDQQLKVIESGVYHKKPKISFETLSSIEGKLDPEIFVDTLTRNNIMGTILGRMQNLESLANAKPETPEERQKRLAQNSSK